MLDQVLHNKNFAGRDGFYWWIGQIPKEDVWKENISGFPAEENTESKGFGERYRVRIMGSHLDSWSGDSATENPDIPDEELPWAILMYPVTAGGGGGASYQSSNLTQGTFVFGFYLDGEDGQQPVIMGTIGYNDFNQISGNSPTFFPTTGFPELDIPTYSLREKTNGNIFADSYDYEVPFNVMDFWTESVNGDNTLLEYGSSRQADDGKKKTQLPPTPDCKSPLASMQLQMKNTIQEIEEARRAAYDFRKNLNKDISKAEDWIQTKLEEGARIVAGAVKWLFTEIEKFIIKQVNDVAKKTYNLLMPNEQPEMKEGIENASDIIACLFKKLIDKLFDIALSFLSNLADKAVNTAECLVNNFVGGLLGQLAGLIDSVVGQAFGAIQSIIDGIGGAVDGLLGLASGGLEIIIDVLSFLDCEEKPECSTVEEWSIWEGAGGGTSGNLDGLVSSMTQVAGSFSGAVDSFDFDLDFDNMFDSGSCDTGPRVCGPPTLDIFGSGTGAEINLIVSGGGEILGGDVVNPGYGYVPGNTYTKVKDDCGIGRGGIVIPVYGGTRPDGTQIGDFDIRDPNGNPSVGIVDIIVIEPGKDYLNAPDGREGGDDRVWKDPEDTVIKEPDGTIQIPIPPDTTVPVNPGDEVTTPPGTEIETDTGQRIPGGIPTIIENVGTITTPPLTVLPNAPIYPVLDTGSYPVILYLCEVIIDNPGVNYKDGDEIVIEPNFGAKAEPKFGEFGKIQSIKVTDGGEGFTEVPKITVKSTTGFNASLIPKFCIDRIGENDVDRSPDLQDKVITVIDCVGKF